MLTKFCDHCHQPLPDERLKISDHKGYKFVPVRDIILLHASIKTVEVWTSAGSQGYVNDSLSHLQARYRRWAWLRRNFLCDPALIETITRLKKDTYEVTVKGYPAPITVARRGWRALQVILNMQQREDLPPLPEDRPKRDFPSSRESPSEFWSEPASTDF